MRRFTLLCLTLWLFPLWTAVSLQAQSLTATVSYIPNQLADIYTPAGPGTFPAIVYIHGGAWRSGSKKDFRKLALDLAAQGYVGFSINYELHAHSFPLSFEQAQDAVRYVRSHAAELHVDPNRILVAGTSAGGEIAALVALAPQGLTAQEKAAPHNPTSARVSGAIILNGVADLSGTNYVIKRYLGGSCLSLPEVCRAASPQQQVHPGAPPFFVGHGTSDHLVPYASAENFIAALHQANVPVTTYTAENGGHSYWEKKHFYSENLNAVEAFLKTIPVSTDHAELHTAR